MCDPLKLATPFDESLIPLLSVLLECAVMSILLQVTNHVTRRVLSQTLYQAEHPNERDQWL